MNKNVNLGDVQNFSAGAELVKIPIPDGYSILMYGNCQVEDSFVLGSNSHMSVVYVGNKQWLCTCIIGKLYMATFAVIPPKKWYRKILDWVRNLLRFQPEDVSHRLLKPP